MVQNIIYAHSFPQPQKKKNLTHWSERQRLICCWADFPSLPPDSGIFSCFIFWRKWAQPLECTANIWLNSLILWCKDSLDLLLMGQSPSNFLGFFWWFQLCLGQDFGILFGSAQFSPPRWDYEHSQCAAALGLGLIPNPAQRWLQILRKKKTKTE